ncbi:MAG: hypothetical protein AAFY41_14375, partial [Bacteroidota bacterium]
MMYKFTLLLVSISFFGCGEKEQEKGVKLVGSLEQFSSDGFAYLEYVGENGVEPFDTLEVDENGVFEEYLAIEEPAFYRLNFNGRQIVPV